MSVDCRWRLASKAVYRDPHTTLEEPMADVRFPGVLAATSIPFTADEPLHEDVLR